MEKFGPPPFEPVLTTEGIDLELLNKNFQGTNWSNARVEGENLRADHTGRLVYCELDRRVIYNGFTTCNINPQFPLYAAVESREDQKQWVEKNMTYRPISTNQERGHTTDPLFCEK